MTAASNSDARKRLAERAAAATETGTGATNSPSAGTDTDLARLRALAEVATPGPWDADTRTELGKTLVCHGLTVIVGTHRAPDAAYIAACSPDVLLGLIERIESRGCVHESTTGSEAERGD